MGRRRYAGRNRNLAKGILIFVLIAILAVGAGYACTKYIITPYFIGGEESKTGGSNQDNQDFSGSAIITDQQEIKDTDSEGASASVNDSTSIETGNQTAGDSQTMTLFCIQYGSFREKAGADAAVSSLKNSNIEAVIIQNDGSYKVIGTPFTKEEEAREALTTMKLVAGEEIFITTMEAWMK